MAVPAELRQVAERAAPVTLARHRTLPVAEPLQPLLPEGAMARGSVVGVAGGPGATSLALALVAAASQAGSWVVVVGLPELGLAAAAEAGLDLDRLAVVDLPLREPAAWAPALAALVGAVDVVVVDGRVPLRATEVRRLAARARERGSVLVPVVPGPGTPVPTGRPARGRSATRTGGRGGAAPVGEWSTDLALDVTAARWEGLGDGHGHLRRRRLTVRAEGRGRAARPRQAELWLPGPGGGVAAAATDPAPVSAHRAEHDLRQAMARTERFLRAVPAGEAS